MTRRPNRKAGGAFGGLGGHRPMARRFFGTDGIRGSANSSPMTSEVALRVGMAAGKLFTNGSYRHRVVIGKDTRLSGYMIENRARLRLHRRRHGRIPARADADAGRRHADPLAPRRSRRDDLRLAQSLRRQRHQAVRPRRLQALRRHRAPDRGADATATSSELLAAPAKIGRADRVSTARRRAISNSPSARCPRTSASTACRVVIDCANGAAYKVAPDALWELGAEVIKIGVDPNGFNINKDCGSTAPTHLLARSVKCAPISASRSTATPIAWSSSTRRAAVIDGDQLMAVIAESWQQARTARRRRHRRHGDVESRA